MNKMKEEKIIIFKPYTSLINNYGKEEQVSKWAKQYNREMENGEKKIK